MRFWPVIAATLCRSLSVTPNKLPTPPLGEANVTRILWGGRGRTWGSGERRIGRFARKIRGMGGAEIAGKVAHGSSLRERSSLVNE